MCDEESQMEELMALVHQQERDMAMLRAVLAELHQDGNRCLKDVDHVILGPAMPFHNV